MQLIINAPSYYKNIYGIDDEIYCLCKEISNFMNDKNYSDLIDRIGMTPIVAPDDIIQKGQWKEEVQYNIKSNLIIVKKHINYDRYVEGSIEEKKKLMIANILKSIKTVHRKGKINYLQFEEDLLKFLGYTKEEIKKY